MLFLIRCAFWLTIVFASMPWPEDIPPPAIATSKGAPMAGDILREARDQAWIKFGSACVSAPIACWRTAMQLRDIAAESKGKAAPQGQTPRP